MGFSASLAAEPWLSNRYAQNCAGCHAPGRKNLRAQDRRCTLACQGCHVSPNGGGMRNHYGKWNENRWLKSFDVKELKHKKIPAPYPKQGYARLEKKISKNPTRKDAGKNIPAHKKKIIRSKGLKLSPALRRKILSEGLAMSSRNGLDYNEWIYDRRDGQELVQSSSRTEWLMQIPRDDPYRYMGLNKLDGGADIRYQLGKIDIDMDIEGNKTTAQKDLNFLMSTDLYGRWRPINRKLHLVYEGRYLGNPAGESKIYEPMSTIGRRSLYVLVEDLPYATYVQAGYYRPLFGNYVPDHEYLPQRMISRILQGNETSYNLQYEALSFGGSPNVPYANVHLLMRQMPSSVAIGSDLPEAYESHKGFAVNLGGRFVTMGLSPSYSYWRSSWDSDGSTTKVEMHSFGVGGRFGLVTATLDAVSLAKDISGEKFVQGGVFSFDSYIQVWRQMYANLAYSLSNTAADLSPGSATQLRVGTRAFIISGVDVNLLYMRDVNETTAIDSTTFNTATVVTSMLGQLHLFL